jgi:transcriptional regulator
MHPNAAFRHDDRALLASLIDQIGFGMVFAATPDGPRVAHVPLVSAGADGAVTALQFHLSRGNAMTKHLDGLTALAVLNGPDGYVSPRWYADQQRVPTWNYLALELEGPVRKLDSDGLLAQLGALSDRQEAQVIGGEPWTMDKVPDDRLRTLQAGIVGFELEIQAWRPTFKLSQDKPEEVATVADALEAQGSVAIAQLMRTFAP